MIFLILEEWGGGKKRIDQERFLVLLIRSVQLEHENVIELVLVTLRDKVEEGGRFLNEEKDPMTLKELNEEPCEVKISCAAGFSRFSEKGLA
ncbi:hypothetical protein Lal_00046733 [Lupinus albus]|nr:hypothetical protein Lal_00046733 [Lupinus albus]